MVMPLKHRLLLMCSLQVSHHNAHMVLEDVPRKQRTARNHQRSGSSKRSLSRFHTESQTAATNDQSVSGIQPDVSVPECANGITAGDDCTLDAVASESQPQQEGTATTQTGLQGPIQTPATNTPAEPIAEAKQKGNGLDHGGDAAAVAVCLESLSASDVADVKEEDVNSVVDMATTAQMSTAPPDGIKVESSNHEHHQHQPHPTEGVQQQEGVNPSSLPAVLAFAGLQTPAAAQAAPTDQQHVKCEAGWHQGVPDVASSGAMRDSRTGEQGKENCGLSAHSKGRMTQGGSSATAGDHVRVRDQTSKQRQAQLQQHNQLKHRHSSQQQQPQDSSTQRSKPLQPPADHAPYASTNSRTVSDARPAVEHDADEAQISAWLRQQQQQQQQRQLANPPAAVVAAVADSIPQLAVHSNVCQPQRQAPVATEGMHGSCAPPYIGPHTSQSFQFAPSLPATAALSCGELVPKLPHVWPSSTLLPPPVSLPHSSCSSKPQYAINNNTQIIDPITGSFLHVGPRRAAASQGTALSTAGSGLCLGHPLPVINSNVYHPHPAVEGVSAPTSTYHQPGQGALPPRPVQHAQGAPAYFGTVQLTQPSLSASQPAGYTVSSSQPLHAPLPQLLAGCWQSNHRLPPPGSVRFTP